MIFCTLKSLDKNLTYNTIVIIMFVVYIFACKKKETENYQICFAKDMKYIEIRQYTRIPNLNAVSLFILLPPHPNAR